MREKTTLPPTAWLSTLLIGIYTLFLAIVEAKIAVFLFYAKNITTAGAHMVSDSETMSDYIGGYLVLPGAFTTILGGLTGVMAFLLAAGIFILFVVCLVTLVISCLLLKKRKLQVDAWMKLIIFFILSILSWLLFRSVQITLLLIIPAVLGIMLLLKINLKRKKRT